MISFMEFLLKRNACSRELKRYESRIRSGELALRSRELQELCSALLQQFLQAEQAGRKPKLDVSEDRIFLLDKIALMISFFFTGKE